MTLEDAQRLASMLDRGGSLREAFDAVSLEVESRAQNLVTLDLEDEEALAKARRLQGEIRGGLAALDRLEEFIREAATPNN